MREPRRENGRPTDTDREKGERRREIKYERGEREDKTHVSLIRCNVSVLSNAILIR